MVEKLSADPPHLQALAALQADLPIAEGSVSDWLDRHRDQVMAVVEGLANWGELAKLLGIRGTALVDWGVRRGLRTRKHREKKQARVVHLRSPRIIRTNNQVVSREFKGIKLTLTLEFLEAVKDAPKDIADAHYREQIEHDPSTPQHI